MTRLIGSGAFGNVFETDNPNVVEKKIIMEDYDDYGISSVIIRESSILHKLKYCSFIVPLLNIKYDVTSDKPFVSLFFTKFKTNLQNQLQQQIFKNEDILKIIYQILLGLKQASDLGFFHRDLKSTNIFLNSENDVVIGDWGLACVTSNNPILTNCVQTLYCRAPEILLGSNQYNNAIDIWSVGCILSEMHGKILFDGNDEKEQTQRIFELLGSPTNIDSLNSLPEFHKTSPIYTRHIHNLKILQEIFNPQVWDLLIHMIELDPLKRFTVDQCLQHTCFDSIRSLFVLPSLPIAAPFSSLFFLKKNKDVNLKMRLILFNWIFEVSLRFKLELHYFFLAITYIDIYLTINLNLNRTHLQLVGLVCLMLAGKLKDKHIHNLSDYCYICDQAYTKTEFLETEIKIVTALQHQLILFSSVNYLQKNSENEEIYRKSSLLLFLLQSRAIFIHPKNILEYYSQNDKCQTIIDVLLEEHPNAILEKMKYIFDSKLKVCLNLNLFKDGNSKIPCFLIS